MREPPAVVLLTFGGRRDRMALLRRYAEEVLRLGIVDEWHVWDFARTSHDQAWLQDSFPALRRTANDCVYRPVSVHVPVAASNVLRCEVRAGHDAHIALLAEAGGPSYEIVLGGWGNSAAALRVWPEGTRPDHTRDLAPPDLTRAAPALLSSRTWRSVEIRLTRDAGQLAIAVTVQGREVLRFAATEAAARPFSVAVMTGYGSEAEWRFAEDRPAQAGLFYAAYDRRFHQWNGVYRFYAGRADEYAETVFLKCDDDIVYLDLGRLADLIRFRRVNAEYFLVSANVVNNGVCGHVQQQLGMVPPELMRLEMPPGGYRGSLWSSGAKSEALHRHFLSNPARFQAAPEQTFVPDLRFSINFVAWLGADLPYFDTRFDDDEHDLTVTLPGFLGRRNAIYLPFVVSHLSFRSQDREMDVAAILDGYRGLAPAECPANA